MASAEPADPVTETPVPVNTNEQKIEKLLSQAAAALKEYRLTKPKNNNARDYYQKVLDLDPQHEKALKGFNSIADAYADLAERKLAKFDYEATRKYVQRGLAIQPENFRLLRLKEKANTGKILAQADTALKEYRLTKPKNNNAYDYYQQVLESQPQHEKALQGITGVANAYADLAERKLDKFEYKEARAYVDRGLTVQPENTRLLALQKDTNAFRDAPKRMWKKFLSPFSKAQ
jgi:serine/threonine-protein kinase PpkA